MNGDTETEKGGTERIQFTCIDCGGEVDREPNKMDVPGLTPRRCAMCTFRRMEEP